MAWFYLILGAMFEAAWAIGLSFSDGFTRLWPSVFTLVTMLISLVLLGIAMRDIPVGTAYAVWTGLGAATVAVLGMIYFGESSEVARIVCIGLILSGVIGLKIFSGAVEA